MANYNIKFNCDSGDGTRISCQCNLENKIYIELEGDNFMNIVLDKSTAIKFAKTLRTEINKIQE